MRYRRNIDPGATYFFTLVTHQRKPLFHDPVNIDRWRSAVAKVQSTRAFTIAAEVILPDHLHTLWTLPEAEADYANRIRLVKSAFTKSQPSLAQSQNTSRANKGEREIWQRRYWEHTIRDDDDFGAHLDYIHFNPAKHGLVKYPIDWPHSTFKDWVAKGVYEATWGSGDMPPTANWPEKE